MPKDPPSIFPGVPASFTRQTTASKSRRVTERRLSITQRAAEPDEAEEFERRDAIGSFANITGRVQDHYGDRYIVKVTEQEIVICDLSGIPPGLTFSVVINDSMNASAYKYSTKVPIHDILGFARQLTRWSQLDEIINRAKFAAVEPLQEIPGHLAQLRSLLPDEAQFLLEQIDLFTCTPRQRRYSPSTTHTALQVFLSSRTAYRTVDHVLCVPSARTLRKHLGRIGDVGGLDECRKAIKEVFLKLNEGQKRCILLFDEMYVKPSVRYRGKHLLGAAIDSPSNPAKTILAIMVKPLFGGPSFVCRLLPILHLTPAMIYDHITPVVEMIKENGGTVSALICDNHPTNRSFYSSLRPDPKIPYRGILCDVPLYLLNDTVHLFKSVRNNWITEKNQHLSLKFENNEITGSWKDVIELYEKEKHNILRRTKMSHPAVYPNAIERQKVSLFCEVFNEKTVAALLEDGKEETSSLLELFVNCWKILNTKSPTIGRRLNDPFRTPLASKNDHRFQLLLSFADAIRIMRGGRSYARTSSLTSETRDSLSSTILGLVSLAKELLDAGHSYVLLGQFQTDRLEGEFGIYR